MFSPLTMNHSSLSPELRSVPLFSSMVRAVQLYVNDADECDPAASMGSTGMKCGDSTEISWGRIDQWMGFVGKIYTGNHGFLPSNKLIGVSCIFSHPIPWSMEEWWFNDDSWWLRVIFHDEWWWFNWFVNMKDGGCHPMNGETTGWFHANWADMSLEVNSNDRSW